MHYKSSSTNKLPPIDYIISSGHRLIGSQLMGSNWPRLNNSQMSLSSILCLRNIFGYCYHLVIGISYSLAQNDLIKWRWLYFVEKKRVFYLLHRLRVTLTFEDVIFEVAVQPRMSLVHQIGNAFETKRTGFCKKKKKSDLTNTNFFGVQLNNSKPFCLILNHKF